MTHWQGEDATLHINGLVKVYNGLTQFVTSTLSDTSYATDKIVEVQEVRKANGLSAMVGSLLPKDGASFETKSEIEGTAQYNCEPAAKDDYEKLVQICTDFESFASTVNKDSDEFMQNWTDGNQRANVKANFEEFTNSSDAYKKILSECRDALSIAVSNVSTIME